MEGKPTCLLSLVLLKIFYPSVQLLKGIGVFTLASAKWWSQSAPRLTLEVAIQLWCVIWGKLSSAAPFFFHWKPLCSHKAQVQRGGWLPSSAILEQGEKTPLLKPQPTESDHPLLWCYNCNVSNLLSEAIRYSLPRPWLWWALPLHKIASRGGQWCFVIHGNMLLVCFGLSFWWTENVLFTFSFLWNPDTAFLVSKEAV